MKYFDKLVDRYLVYPIMSDVLIVIAIWLLSKKFSLFEFILKDKSNQINITSNIISADVSLAGFILAALTIIVTFKSNVQSKGMTDATNALELIFSSKHYSRIVYVFRKSLIELVMCFIFLFCACLSKDNLSIWTINRINVTGILITSFAISRSLFILFMILDLENHKRSDE